MARSKYIYMAYKLSSHGGNEDEFLAARTVKHELITYIKRHFAKWLSGTAGLDLEKELCTE